MVKGVRHIEMRFWFTRDTLLKGQFVLTHMPADHLTKLGNIQEHRAFTQQILGLTLLKKCKGQSPCALSTKMKPSLTVILVLLMPLCFHFNVFMDYRSGWNYLIHLTLLRETKISTRFQR
jgi:hypothetical protein